MMQANATFDLDHFDQSDPYEDEDGVAFSQTKITKTYRGDIKGHSTVQMLGARCPDGAGYVALERIRATVLGKEGTFSLLHAGTMTIDERWAKWPIVPGSGTGDLAGIRGEGQIVVEEDGTHSFTLDFEL